MNLLCLTLDSELSPKGKFTEHFTEGNNGHTFLSVFLKFLPFHLSIP